MRKDIFILYSLRSLFFARTRQKLLLLALLGLFLSCFALLVLQCTLGGLQRNLQTRSQEIIGHGEFLLREDQSEDFSSRVQDRLRQEGVISFREYELELLVRRKDYLAPMIIHGVDMEESSPAHLKELAPGLSMGWSVAARLKAILDDQVELISPSHLDPFLGGIPRKVSEPLANILLTGVPEVNRYHGWVRDSLIHNLIQEVRYNKIRHYGKLKGSADTIVEEFGGKLRYRSWEQINEVLLWSLKLESTVILVLFAGMTLLVAISITSGFFIFFQKIKREMVSFWITGVSERELSSSCLALIHFLALLTCGGAIVLGLIFLWGLESWSPVVMPDIFMDRNIPVHITVSRILLAFSIPYGVAVIFSHFSLSLWKRSHRSEKLAMLR